VRIGSSVQTTTHQGVSGSGDPLLSRSLFRESPGGADEPSASLIELRKPGAVIKPHFHLVDQFQVVVGGEGRMGKNLLTPVSFHYADAYTPYGPIIGGPMGIQFLTLRAHTDKTWSHYMPESRHEMKRKAGRGLACKVEMDQGQTLFRSGSSVLDTLWEVHDDGLAAFMLRVGPGVSATGPDPSIGGGQCLAVLNGSLIYQDEELPLWSCLFVTPDEGPPGLTAGPSGFDALVLEFPKREAGRGLARQNLMHELCVVPA